MTTHHIDLASESEVQSSWIHSVTWYSDEELLIVKTQKEDNPKEVDEVFRYTGISKTQFDRINEAYENGNSVGVIINEHIIRAKDIDQADSMGNS